MRKFTALLIVGLVAAGAARARAGVSVDVRVGSPPPRPIYVGPVYGGAVVGHRFEQVWVPPVTDTVTQNVWHEPVTEDRVDRTWVPDRFQVRDVPTTDVYGRPATTRQSVLVEPGHWQETRTAVVVRAGYYAPEAQTVVVRPGYWQTVEQPVVVDRYCGPVVTPYPYYEDRVHVRYDSGGRGDRWGDRGGRYGR